ncbi:MAG: ABC transporter ATP-binding protein, partial [Oscillochloris sp.]|nr:ABC transporter ATP-binding protein [Oscillochloris sp.]
MSSLSPTWRLLAAYLAPQRALLALLALLVFGGAALQLVGPQIIRAFIDATQTGQPGGALLRAAGVYLAVSLAQRAAALGAAYLGEDLGWRTTNQLRADLTRHVLGLDMGFHKAHSPGELIERLDGDITALANLFSQFSVRVLGSAALIVGALGLLWREEWRASLGLGAYALLAVVGLGALQRFASERWQAERQAQAAQYGFLEERMAGTEEIRANGAEAHVLQRFRELLQATSERYRAARLLGNLAAAITSLATTVAYAAGLAIGAALYLHGDASIGTAFLVVAYVGMLSTPLEQLRAQAQDLQRAAASVGRVAALRAEQPLVIERAGARLPVGPLAVEIDAVSFSYAEGAAQPAAALHAISLALRPGEVLGLLGRTGSGKTTLTRLLFRLYDLASGAIKLDDVDLRDVPLADLRERIGMVTQDVQLFQASVRDNLTFFDPRIGDAQIARVLQDLQLREWLQSLPAGLDTPLAGGGQF